MNARRGRTQATSEELKRLRLENLRLSVLHGITKDIAATMSRCEIVERFAGPLREVLPYDVLHLHGLERGTLALQHIFPSTGSRTRAETPPVGTRVRSIAMSEQRAVHFTDVCPAEPGDPVDAAHRGVTLGSALAAPMFSDEAIIGTLSLFRSTLTPFGDGDASYLQDVSNQLANSLKNSLLCNNLLDVSREWGETFRASPDLLAVVDRDLRILRINRGVGGRTIEEMIGRRCAEVFDFCADEAGAGPIGQAFRTRQEASAALASPDRERALGVSAYPVCGPDGDVARVVMVARDVTASRRMESQLFQSAKLAAIGEMAAGVAHELNSPLTAVIGNASLLLRRSAPDDKAYRMLSDIKMCGHRCKKIITNMLTFARQDSYVLEPLRLNDVVLSGLDLIEYQLSKGAIRVDRRLDPGLPAVLGNSQQIEQVLVNLLLNARDALEGCEEKVITVTTGFSELDGGHLGVALTVSDTGVGIPAPHRERVFDPFFTTKEATKGTGLGLSVSMGIAKAHGGALTVESRPGAGSAFSLVLPFPEQRLEGGGRESTARAPATLPTEALERLRPSLELAQKLGRLHAQLGTGDPAGVRLEGLVDGAAWGTGLLTAAALAGVLAPSWKEGMDLDLAGARRVARERGIRVHEAATAVGDDPACSVRVTVETAAGTRTLAGALFGKREARLVEIDGIRVEATLQGHLLIFWAHDRPGLVGSIASVLAARGIGIRQMRSAAEPGAGTALAVFHVDTPAADEVLGELARLPSLVRVARATV